MLDLSVNTEQKVKVTITPLSASGKPAKVDGKPTWTVTSGVGTVQASDDGMSAFLVSGDVPGDTIVLIEADADLGEGVETISDTIQLHVQGVNAANLGLTASAPEPK